MAEGEPVSPNAFSRSVHNTVSSLFSIARGDRTHSTAMAAGPSTLEGGFLEASGLLAEAPAASALLVYYDEPLPSFYSGKADAVPTSAALAMLLRLPQQATAEETVLDRKSVVSGKRVSVRVDLGGRRIIKKKKK